MIYILSSSNDVSTSEVIEWLYTYGKKFKFIDNFIDVKKDFKLSVNKNKIKDNNRDKSIWYRKLGYYPNIQNKDVLGFYNKENLNLLEFIFDSNKYKTMLGVPFNYNVNKLGLIVRAEKYGLNIPQTIVTNSKKKLIVF